MHLGRFELRDERVLGAVRFVDGVTGLPIRETPQIVGARVSQSGSGLTVIRAPAPLPSGLDHYVHRFRGPPHADEAAPGTVALTLEVRMPSGRYLARQVTLNFPRQAESAEQPDYLLNPIEVTLYPASTYGIEPLWAVLRLSILQQGSTPAIPLAGVVVSAVTPASAPNPNIVLGRGLSDRRGELLLVVPGLRPATLLSPETSVNLEARRDNTSPGLPDPDQLINAAGDEPWLAVAQRTNVVIAPGQTRVDQIAMG